MVTVKIQVKENGKSWEETEAVEHTFNQWKDVTTFTYRLALHFNRQVRVEVKGNGHYYEPFNAVLFLNN